jgi:hypothetical protein
MRAPPVGPDALVDDPQGGLVPGDPPVIGGVELAPG